MLPLRTLDDPNNMILGVNNIYIPEQSIQPTHEGGGGGGGRLLCAK